MYQVHCIQRLLFCTDFSTDLAERETLSRKKNIHKYKVLLFIFQFLFWTKSIIKNRRQIMVVTGNKFKNTLKMSYSNSSTEKIIHKTVELVLKEIRSLCETDLTQWTVGENWALLVAGALVCLSSKSLQSMSGDKIRKVIVFNSHGQQELVPQITGINRLIILCIGGRWSSLLIVYIIKVSWFHNGI